MPVFAIRTVNSSGEPDQPLPSYESLSLSPIFCEPGTVSIKYPATGVNFDLLHDDVEIAVMMDGVEIEELRCIIESSDGDDASDAEKATVWTFTARTMQALLDRAVVYPMNWPVTEPASHEFISRTPGYMLRILLEEAQVRGSLIGLDWDFGDLVDSNGDDWIAQYDMSFSASTKYSEVIGNMVENGLCEIEVVGRTIRLFNQNGMGVDLTTGTEPLMFIKGKNIKDSPRKSSTRELATVMLISGDEGIYVERESSSPIMSQWGRREIAASQSGVTDAGILTLLADWQLGSSNRPVTEVSHGLYFDVADAPIPITDFRVGDWGLSDVGNGWESLRIKQWTAEIGNEITGSVVLNDLIAEYVERLNRKLTGIQNGTTITGGSESDSEKDDGKAPGVVENLTASSEFYFEEGQPRAAILVSWTALEENYDGSTMTDLAGYQIRWKYQGNVNYVDQHQVAPEDTSTTFLGAQTGTIAQVQVRAFDKFARYGAWSPLESTNTAVDEAAPQKPSAPTLTPKVGRLEMVWDGKSDSGTEMDADVAMVQVHLGPNGTFTPDETTLKAVLPGAFATSVSFIEDLEYGSEYWVRLVAIDHSGNISPASDETSTSHTVLSPIFTQEIGTGAIGLDNTRFSEIGNLIDDPSFEDVLTRLSRQDQMTGTDFSFDNTTSSTGGWSVKVSGHLGFPTQYLVVQENLPVKPTERIFGAADYRLTLNASAAATVDVGVYFKDFQGNILDEEGVLGDVNDFFPVTTSSNAIQDNLWQLRITENSRPAPPNARYMDIAIQATGLAGGSIWIDALEVRRQIHTALIEEAAITSAKIASLAVQDAHIADLDVGKLTTGELTANMILSSTISTSVSTDFPRLDISADGIQMYNVNEVKTVDISTSTGSVDMVGTLSTGLTGSRIVINPYPVDWVNPEAEIRFYAEGSGTKYSKLIAENYFDDLVKVTLQTQSAIDGETGENTLTALEMASGDFGLGVYRVVDVIGGTYDTVWGGYIVGDSHGLSLGRQKGGLNDNSIDFTDTGKMYYQGEFAYYSDNQNALMMGQGNDSGTHSTFTLSYGPTQTSAPRVIAQFNDGRTAGSGLGCSVQDLTESSFKAVPNGTTSGDYGLIYWAFRT